MKKILKKILAKTYASSFKIDGSSNGVSIWDPFKGLKRVILFSMWLFSLRNKIGV